jgi:hypothetical protein
LTLFNDILFPFNEITLAFDREEIDDLGLSLTDALFFNLVSCELD